MPWHVPRSGLRPLMWAFGWQKIESYGLWTLVFDLICFWLVFAIAMLVVGYWPSLARTGLSALFLRGFRVRYVGYGMTSVLLCAGDHPTVSRCPCSMSYEAHVRTHACTRLLDGVAFEYSK